MYTLYIILRKMSRIHTPTITKTSWTVSGVLKGFIEMYKILL
jgi:hypothetical protein